MIILQTLITTKCVNRCHHARTGRLVTNNIAFRCNRSVSLLDFEGHLMGLVYYIKDCVLTQAIVYPWLKMVAFGVSVMMLK